MGRNLETVKGVYEAFGRGDVAAILDALADDVAWEAWADNSAAKAAVPWLLPGAARTAPPSSSVCSDRPSSFATSGCSR